MAKKVLFAVYVLTRDVRNKLYSMLIRNMLFKCGSGTLFVPPLRIAGASRIEIGQSVYIESNSWLQTLDDGDNHSVAILIGSGTSIAGCFTISAVRSVIIEKEVLIARNVYISDHKHQFNKIGTPIIRQGIDGIAPVAIKQGAWIGQNCIICPGVTIGKGAVIGANSVVRNDVPDFCVAAGSPANVIRHIGGLSE